MLFLKDSRLTILALAALFVQLSLCKPQLKELRKRQFDSDALEDQVEAMEEQLEDMEEQLEDMQEQTEDCNERVAEYRRQSMVNDWQGQAGGNGFGNGFGDFWGWGGMFFDDRRRRAVVEKMDREVERPRRQWPVNLFYQQWRLSQYLQNQQQLLNICLQELSRYQPATPTLPAQDTTPASVLDPTTAQAATQTTQAATQTTQAATQTTQPAPLPTTQPPADDPTTLPAEDTTT